MKVGKGGKQKRESSFAFQCLLKKGDLLLLYICKPCSALGIEEGKEGGWKDICKEGLGEGAWREGGRDWRDGKDNLKVWEGGWKDGGWDWKERREGYSKTPRLKVLLKYTVLKMYRLTRIWGSLLLH